MDEYTSLAGTSIVTPPHGKVSELTPKRRIGDRKKQKRDGKEKREKEREGVIVHGRVQESLEENDVGGSSVEEDRDPDERDMVVRYGKRLPGEKRKRKIDLTI
jgi:hypothetical protein